MHLQQVIYTTEVQVTSYTHKVKDIPGLIFLKWTLDLNDIK